MKAALEMRKWLREQYPVMPEAVVRRIAAQTHALAITAAAEAWSEGYQEGYQDTVETHVGAAPKGVSHM